MNHEACTSIISLPLGSFCTEQVLQTPGVLGLCWPPTMDTGPTAYSGFGKGSEYHILTDTGWGGPYLTCWGPLLWIWKVSDYRILVPLSGDTLKAEPIYKQQTHWLHMGLAYGDGRQFCSVALVLPACGVPPVTGGKVGAFLSMPLQGFSKCQGLKHYYGFLEERCAACTHTHTHIL